MLSGGEQTASGQFDPNKRASGRLQRGSRLQPPLLSSVYDRRTPPNAQIRVLHE